MAYTPPGVYVKTDFQQDSVTFVGTQRLPLLVGVGQEELEQLDFPLVRGSSTSVDQQIVDEDVSASWVVDNTNPNNPVLGAQNGTLTTFRVKNYPIVNGNGFGITTNDTKLVVVTVNGVPVALESVQGAKGLVSLPVPTQPTDLVRVTYYMHRGDTAFTDDVSDQVSVESATLISPGFQTFNIVAGASDTFIFKVDGVTKTVTFLANPAATAAALKSQIDALLAPGLSTSVFVDPAGRSHLQLDASVSLEILDGNANGPLGWSPGTATSRNRSFRVFNIPVTDGLGGGVATTDPSKVVVKVDNVQVIPSSVDGQNGVVTLPSAPAPGATVTVAYWANTWQDTFDFLPNSLVTSSIRCGISPGRSDYINGADFVLENPDASTSVIHWGASKSVSSTKRTTNATPFDGVQITTTLVDDRLFLQECAPVVNSNVIPAVTSTTEFLLPAVPTMGNGRDTPLSSSVFKAAVNGRQDLISNRPDLVIAYAGHSLTDALTRSPVKVVAVDGATRKITLQSSLPPDHKVYATFWFSRLTDDEFLLTNKTAGPIGVGTYEVLSTLTGKNLFQTLFGTKTGLSDTVQWPRGNEFIPDAYHTGDGTPVNETVTVTFGTQVATFADFVNRGAEPYNLYNGTSATWDFTLTGNNYPVSLNGQSRAFLFGSNIVAVGGVVTVPAAPGNVFNVSIDGVDITVNLTVGGAVPLATLVADINTAIDAHPSFVGTAPNNLVSVSAFATGDFYAFCIRGYSTPAALPGGFDHASSVQILSGTAESILGYTAFQQALGTPRATNKPATLLSTIAGNYNITAGLNDVLDIRVDGVDYSVTLPNGVAVTPAAVVAAINAVVGSVVASVGTLANVNKIRLTSTIATEGSSLVIVGGSSLDVLGFTQGDTASQTQVLVEEIVDRLLSTVGVLNDSVIRKVSIGGNNYLQIQTLATGTTAAISFNSSANSAFNLLSGLNITPGVDGDSGDASHDNYTVTSTHPSGSTGTGIPGQTFTASSTGLRFTILPATDGSYTGGGSFTLLVAQTFKVHPTIPTYALGGLEMTVSNTVGVGVDDVATVKTFNPSGLEPKNSDIYYLSYRYSKQDYTEKYFRQFKALESNFGTLDPQNALTLGGFLAIQNGAPVVVCKQVKKATNSGQASDVAFIEALNDSAVLEGNYRPNLLVCLTSSTTVAAALTQHCEVQSNFRNQSERTGIIGFASNTSPSSAQSVARGLKSQRIMAVYPDTAAITLTNELGENFTTAISGVFLAAAVLGTAANPTFDVATPYTRRRIVGIDRLLRAMEPLDMDNTAAAGITVLVDNNPIIQIRHGLTTNMDTVLTRTPTVTQIADFNAQGVRAILDGYIGSKNLRSRTGEIEESVVPYNKTLVQGEILSGFAQVKATVDPSDPTAARLSEYIAPIFPLDYIYTNVGVRSSLLAKLSLAFL